MERSQFEAEQEVEATISVCETSPSSVCSDEDMHTACVTSGPPVGEHAVPVSVSLSSSLPAFASARVGWADLITLAGVALVAAEPASACFLCGSLFPGGRPSYLQRSSSSCCLSGGRNGPPRQWPPARPSQREINSEQIRAVSRPAPRTRPLNTAPALLFSVGQTAVLRVRLFHANHGIAGRQAADRRVW